MKIGILTYHRSHNYGAMLQAYATRVIFESLGCEVYYIDYWPDHQKKIYQIFDIDRFRGMRFRLKYMYIIEILKTIIPKLIRRHHFDLFFRNYILPYTKTCEESFDVVLYGSDQIWRKQWLDGDKYNPVYFANNNFKTKKHISFAASMGDLPQTEEDVNKIQKLLLNFSIISVRENSLLSFLHKIGYKKAVLVLDPTLIIDNDYWNKLVVKQPIIKEKYILYYELIEGSFDEEQVRIFAKAHKMKIITLKGVANKMPTKYYRNTDGPLEFLNLIKNASLICTSSYHAVVFSIIFGTPFYCSFYRNSKRAESLLEGLGLLNRLLPCRSMIPNFISKSFDAEICKKLEAIRYPSNQFAEDLVKKAL